MHRFQSILDGSVPPERTWDRPLYSSPSFVAVPSLGALVPGWLLIVPRRAVLNLRDLTPDEWKEFDDFVLQVSEKLKAFNNPIYQFEHGSIERGSLMGCGADQAHLHLVPLDFDLLRVAKLAGGSDMEWERVTAPKSIGESLPSAGEYIAIRDPRTSDCLVGASRKPQSQWVRRVIAKQIGDETAWDYKTNPQHRILSETLSVLSRI